MGEKIRLWMETCAEYERILCEEGNLFGAEYHRGAKEAFQRVLDEILVPPPLGICTECATHGGRAQTHSGPCRNAMEGFI